jgi:glycosyltransferase involved in cell wall biosynthesis
MEQILRIYVTSYACAPDSGSEAGNGWNWPLYLSKAGCEVTVVTSPRWESTVASRLAEKPVPGLSLRVVRPPDWPLRLGWQVGSKLQYIIWLWRVATLGRRLHSERPFDLCHHVSWGSLAAGNFLWRIPVPYVVGPVGGGQVAPEALRPYFESDWRTEAVRTFMVKRIVPWSPLARRTCKLAGLVMVSNDETGQCARELGARSVALTAPDSGLPCGFAPESLPTRSAGHSLKLMWVGRIFALRGLPLALDALSQVHNADVTLHIFGGGGRENDVESWIADRGLQERVVYHGHVEWSVLREHYRSSDAFLFTSLRDSCAAQLLEAMAWGLPVITLDQHGAACAVPDSAGLKIPVTTIEEVRRGLSTAITMLADEPETRARMSEAAYAHAAGFSWPRIVERTLAQYEALLAEE